MKKSNMTWFISFTLFSLLLAISSCDSKGKTDLLPHVSTTSASEIAQNSVKSGGTITTDGGSAITSRGVCWSLSPNPVNTIHFTSDGAGTGTFNSTVTGLASGTIYYIRAYATNSSGTGYGADIKITTTGNPGIVTDIDGNTYQSITIGTQTWLSGNLKTTRYRTGESISNVTNAALWSTAIFGAWCDYNNDTANGTLYGKLYNWAALKDARNITPDGWHVATQEEWTTLVTFLGGESVAAGKLKESGFTHWKNSATGGSTNEVGFSALPGGSRDPSGAFGSMGDNGYWWTLTENTTTNPVNAWYWYMNFDNSNAHKDYSSKMYGRSVRCVKDKN